MPENEEQPEIPPFLGMLLGGSQSPELRRRQELQEMESESAEAELVSLLESLNSRNLWLISTALLAGATQQNYAWMRAGEIRQIIRSRGDDVSTGYSQSELMERQLKGEK